jgi:hypothetical protein
MPISKKRRSKAADAILAKLDRFPVLFECV